MISGPIRNGLTLRKDSFGIPTSRTFVSLLLGKGGSTEKSKTDLFLFLAFYLSCLSKFATTDCVLAEVTTF